MSELTNGIPICPFCKKPTKRTGGDYCTVTAAYYPPVYDENGVDINPDRNRVTRTYQCLECGERYEVVKN